MAIWSGLTVAVIGGTIVWAAGLGGDRVLRAPDQLTSGWLALAGGCLGIWLLLVTTPPEAIRLSPRLSKRLLLTASLLCALPMLLLAPVLSSELLRYRYDGRAWLLGTSPYVVLPEEPRTRASENVATELGPDLLDRAVPEGGHASLNLPVSQAGFIAAGTVEYLFPALTTRLPDSEPEGYWTDAFEMPLPTATAPAETVDPAEWRERLAELPAYQRLFPWRLLVLGFYLLAVGELIAWLRLRRQSPWWAVLFAWQPLVLVEFVGMGHQDMLGVAFLIASLRRTEMGRFRRASLCLAAAVAVKPLALLALPFLIRSGLQRDTDGSVWRTPAVRRVLPWFSGTLFVLCLPLFLGDYAGQGWVGWGHAAGNYFRSAEPGGSIYRLLEWAFLGDSPEAHRLTRVRVAAWILFFGGVAFAGAIAWLRRLSGADAFYATSLTALILLPMSPPWLVIWPLAMVPVLAGRGGLTALVWAATASLFYAHGPLETEPDLATSLSIYIPVMAAALIETIVFFRRSGRRAGAAAQARAV